MFELQELYNIGRTKVLNIFVPPFKVEASKTPTGKSVMVYPMVIVDRETRKTIQLQDQRSEYFEGETQLEFSIRRWYFPKGKSLILRLFPKDLEDGIIDALRIYNGKKDDGFDCYAFICLVKKLDKRYPMYENWKLHPYSRWTRKVGDVVYLLSKAASKSHHAAIYIGHGLYISVYGKGGNIELATMRDMKKTWSTKKVYTATPR